LILHVPTLSSVAPKIFLSTFLSNSSNLFFIGVVSHVLSLCTRPGSLMPRPQYSWALIPQHSLKRGLGGPQRWSGLLRDEKILLPGKKRPDPTINDRADVPNKLFRVP